MACRDRGYCKYWLNVASSANWIWFPSSREFIVHKGLYKINEYISSWGVSSEYGLANSIDSPYSNIAFDAYACEFIQ